MEEEMYLGPIEDLTLAKMADYDRLVKRLLLEKEAKAAAAEYRKGNSSGESRLQWVPGRRRQSPAS
jgi:hypothetical protein